MVTPEQLRLAKDMRTPEGYQTFTNRQLVENVKTDDADLGQKIEKAMQKGVTREQALNYYTYGSSRGNAEKQKPKVGFFEGLVQGIPTAVDYATSPFRAIVGGVEKGINKVTGSNFYDQGTAAENYDETLQKAGSTARVALPLIAGLATGGAGLIPSASAVGLAGATGRGINETTDAVTGVDEQPLTGRVMESATEGVIAGATDLVAGKALKVAGKVGKKLLSPFASRFDSEVAALATKKGMDLPVSSMSKSNVVKQLETIAQKGFAGGVAEEQVETATKQLSSMSDDLVKSLGGSDDFTVAGKSVLEGADTFRDAWRASKGKAYSMASTLLKNSDAGAFTPNTSATVSVIDEILGSKQAASHIMGQTPVSDTVTGILQTMKQNLTSGKPLPLESFTSTLDELNKLTKFGSTLVSTGDQAVLKKVIATMDQDVTTGLRSIAPKAAAALEKADSIYSKGIRLLDSEFGNKIAKLSDNPTKIVDQLITPKSVDDVPGIFELIGKGKNGPKRIQDVQTAFARKLVESAKGQDGIIGNQLDNAIDRYGESTVRAVLGDDALQGLREIQKIAGAVNRGQSVAKGSQTAFITKITAFVTALLTFNVPAAAAIAGGDITLAKLFNTQWFRTWLTRGFEVPQTMSTIGKGAGEVARRAAVSGAQQLSPNE